MRRSHGSLALRDRLRERGVLNRCKGRWLRARILSVAVKGPRKPRQACWSEARPVDIALEIMQSAMASIGVGLISRRLLDVPRTLHDTSHTGAWLFPLEVPYPNSLCCTQPSLCQQMWKQE